MTPFPEVQQCWKRDRREEQGLWKVFPMISRLVHAWLQLGVNQFPHCDYSPKCSSLYIWVVMVLNFYLLIDLLLQSEEGFEAELHPQLSRAPSQAAENSPTKKVRPAQGCHCGGICEPSLGFLASVSSSTVLRFSCPDVNVNGPDFLEFGFFVKMGS